MTDRCMKYIRKTRLQKNETHNRNIDVKTPFQLPLDEVHLRENSRPDRLFCLPLRCVWLCPTQTLLSHRKHLYCQHTGLLTPSVDTLQATGRWSHCQLLLPPTFLWINRKSSVELNWCKQSEQYWHASKRCFKESNGLTTDMQAVRQANDLTFNIQCACIHTHIHTTLA